MPSRTPSCALGATCPGFATRTGSTPGCTGSSSPAASTRPAADAVDAAGPGLTTATPAWAGHSRRPTFTMSAAARSIRTRIGLSRGLQFDSMRKTPEDLTHGEVCLCDRWSDLLPRQGHHRRQRGPPVQGTGPQGLHPQARSVHQRGSGDHVPVPARRGVRHRRRGGDGPRPRALRAVHRREPDPGLERDDRPHLPGGDRQGAAGRLPRRHRPGDPAHHQRDQGADRAGRPRRRPGRGDRRGRRDGRRHREPAVPRGHPPDAQGRRARERAVRPRDAAARPRGDRASSRRSQPSTP